MDELRELYYNPKTGLISPYKLYVKLNKTIPLKTIEAFINQQESYQIKKHVKGYQSYKPIKFCRVQNFHFKSEKSFATEGYIQYEYI